MNGGKKSGKLHVFGAGGAVLALLFAKHTLREGQQAGCRNRQNEGDRRCDQKVPAPS